MAFCKGSGRGEASEEASTSISTSTSTVGDALVMATMLIVGRSVEVQMKDGSIYSGIFHTARPDKDYAIVLKKARKICSGSFNANLDAGTLIETLVVLPGDFVQVIAKDVTFSAEELGNTTDVIGRANGFLGSKDCANAVEGSIKAQNSHKASNTTTVKHCDQNIGTSVDAIRTTCLEVGKVSADPSLENGASCANNPIAERGENGDESKEASPSVSSEGIMKEITGNTVCLKQFPAIQISSAETIIHLLDKGLVGTEEILTKVASYTSSDDHKGSTDPDTNGCAKASVRQVTSNGEMTTKACLSASVSNISVSSGSSSASPALYIPSSTSSLGLGSPDIAPASTKSIVDGSSLKAFKLNPGAKTFLPSYARPTYPPPVPAPSTTLSVASAPFIPANAINYMSIGGMQSAVEMSAVSNQPSAPTKFAVYNNFSSADYASFQHPRAGAHCNTRSPLPRSNAQQYLPVQNAQQYLPVQIGPGYLHPTPQTATVDRMVQHLYMQPLQDSIQSILPELAAPSYLPPPPSPRPLLTPYQYNNIPKLQQAPAPTLQLCAVPPVMTGQSQLYAPFAQPLHMVPTIPVPGGNGVIGCKFYA